MPKTYPPITSFRAFMKALKCARERHGYEFMFCQTFHPIWDEEGWAYGNAIFHNSPESSFWTPMSVVDRAFYSPNNRTWSHEGMAWKNMGMPHEKYLELLLACHERSGHLVSLREQLCDAVGLVEIPIHERDSYHVVENMNQRRK